MYTVYVFDDAKGIGKGDSDATFTQVADIKESIVGGWLLIFSSGDSVAIPASAYLLVNDEEA